MKICVSDITWVEKVTKSDNLKPKKLQSQNEKSKTENKHNLNECLAKISNLEIELKEADDINNKKVFDKRLSD